MMGAALFEPTYPTIPHIWVPPGWGGPDRHNAMIGRSGHSLLRAAVRAGLPGALHPPDPDERGEEGGGGDQRGGGEGDPAPRAPVERAPDEHARDASRGDDR